MNSCEVCVYRHAVEDHHLCRYSPPILVTVGSNNTWLWPRVQLTDWCGHGSHIETGSTFSPASNH